MCFMFGASKEQVRRVLGLIEKEEHEEGMIEETVEPVTSAGVLRHE
ncbi:hypothetical protein ACFOWZ_08115 [Lentzea rhizosphaerae]|uniref:Uncharacterized protein n=1 Tax=Lentzea rhizosphaerae TaxID=2041025 RepID=A0ABV8BMB4_9PSEU